MSSRFLINIDNGIIAFRNEYVDKQVNMKPIPDAVVKMVMDKEVSVEDVVKAVNAHIRESGEFDDVEKYLKERAKLNVRKSNPQKNVQRAVLADRSSEEISVGDVLAVKNGDEPKDAKKSRAKKLNDAIDADDAPHVKVNI